ncbi:DUF2634 domain-containing protein [Apilactobacillus sp. TMW 2.2459]|uniref:DUF2634 domain-containing protein n=1 Tax=Apilactobacillus xinyiensis TaxID=2841032 RepID=UPI00200D29C3|nr:DUF2634 domain-containing protein [Apilactobacillus xinyiensis]MCL0312781.1 DUF2634 domain-containing protein [Apilactobacillus xinyiensis]
MKDIALDKSGQPIFNGQDFKMLYDADAVAQQVYITLQSILGEFEPDKNLGLSQDNLFGKSVVEDFIAQDIRDAIIEQVDEVESVDEIEFEDEENRVLTVNIACTTKSYGQIDNSYNFEKEV